MVRDFEREWYRTKDSNKEQGTLSIHIPIDIDTPTIVGTTYLEGELGVLLDVDLHVVHFPLVFFEHAREDGLEDAAGPGFVWICYG